jgi:hypothetical protein
MNTLNSFHENDLLQSGIDKETASNAGYYSTTYRVEHKDLNCWAIDFYNPFTGNKFLTRYRLDKPLKDGKLKYIQPKDSAQGIYFSRLIGDDSFKIFADQEEIPVILGEGEKKIDCLIKYLTKDGINYAPIGLTGVWNWGKDHELNDLLQRFVIKNRKFIIIVDSDFKTNNNIKQGIYRLSEKLLDYGCKVNLVIVPGNPENKDKKYGIDDYLAQYSLEERSSELSRLINNGEKLIIGLTQQPSEVWDFLAQPLDNHRAILV